MLALHPTDPDRLTDADANFRVWMPPPPPDRGGAPPDPAPEPAPAPAPAEQEPRAEPAGVDRAVGPGEEELDWGAIRDPLRSEPLPAVLELLGWLSWANVGGAP